MTDFRKEIDLAIRAKLTGQNDLATITKSISALEDAITSQAAAAKKGIGSIDDLKESYKQLETVADQLKAAGGLVSAFEKQQGAIDATNARIQKYNDALTALDAKQQQTGKTTDAQVGQRDRLNASIEKSSSTLQKQQSVLQTLAEQLTAAGIATDGLAASQTRILEAAAQTGIALAKNRDAQNSYNTDLKAATAILTEQANAEKLAIANANALALADKAVTEALNEEAAAQARMNAASQAAAAKNAGLDSSNSIRQTSLDAQKGAAYIKFWHDELDKADQAIADTAANNAKLSTLADTAVKTAAGFSSLAVASTNLAPSVATIRDTIDAIINPAATARQTLQGVEQEITSLSETISAIKGPVTEYREQFAALVAVQKSLAGQASLVDTFRQQQVALKQAEDEFARAKQQVTQYADEVRKGGDSGQSFVKSLNDSQQAAAKSGAALQQQVAATRAAAQALRDAGIDSTNLVAAEAALVRNATEATSATRGLTEAVNQYGTAAASSGKNNGIFGDEGRTTLSFMQRLRGEILALAASYIGLQGAVNIATEAIAALGEKQQIQTRLAVVVGNDPKAIGDEYKYLHDQAIYYGVGLDSLADSYSRFSIAAKSTNLNTQQSKFIFEQLTAAMRVQGASTEKITGAFEQFQQALGKGKLQWDDLKAAGNSFLGLEPLVARGLQSIGYAGIGAANPAGDLFKIMKKGAVDSGVALFALATQVKKEYGDQIPAALKTLIAEQGRFQTTFFDLKTAIGEAGFGTAYTELLSQLTTFFKSDDGKKFAQDLSDKFTLVANVLVIVVKNFDALMTIIGTIVALKVVGVVGDLAASMLLLAANAGKATVALTGVELAASRIKGAFSLVSAFVAGWEIGTLLYEKFAFVRNVGAIVIGTFDSIFTQVGAQASLFVDHVQQTFIDMLKAIVGAVRGFTSAIGATEVTKSLDLVFNDLTKRYAAIQKTSDATKKKLADDLKGIHDNVMSGISANDTGVGAVAKPGSINTPNPGAPKPKPIEDDKAIAARQKQVDEINRSLDTLEAKIDRTQTNTLKQQLQAIDVQTDALFEKIQKLSPGKDKDSFTAQLATDTNQLKLQATQKFNDDLAKQEEVLQNRIEGMEAQAGKKSADELGKRLAATVTQYADTYRDIAALRAKLTANGLSTQPADDQEKAADAAIVAIQDTTRRQFAVEQLAKAEKTLTDTVADRDKLISAENAKETARVEDDATRVDNINKIYATAAPQIQAAADAAKQLAEANANAFDNPGKQQLFIAGIDAITAKANTASVAYTQLQMKVQDVFTGAAGEAIDKVAESIGGLVAGTLSWRDALGSIGSTFLQMTAQILKGIAEQILKQEILNAVLAISKALGWGGASTDFSGVGDTTGLARGSFNHTGGVIGQVQNRTFVKPAAIFANAPRYHSGGIPGLAPDEYATILQKNEEVLAANSPRNVLNGGGMTAQADGGGSNRFVLVDDRARVPEAMNSADGEKVTLLHLRANIPTVKQWLGVK